MPSVSRAPNIPRKIRNLKPKRQLPRNGKVNDRDDEWWHNNVGSATPPAGVHSRAATASNESFGTRLRFTRPKVVLDASISQEAAENEHENEANRTNSISTPKQLWEKFKSTPTRKKIKRFIAGMVLFTALKSIYFADLDDYQYSQTGYSAHTTSLSTKKTDSGPSLLRSNVGDVKSLSELLGDDHLGVQSESYKSPTKTGGELGQNNKITGKFMGESIGRDKYGSSNIMNDNSMQSASFNSFGSKSMSDSFGSVGQNNLGYSNTDKYGRGKQSASFNSFGSKSMSDSFGSSGQSNFGSSNTDKYGDGVQSASFNSFGSKSMSDSFGSSGQSNLGSSNTDKYGSSMQSASFNSFDSKSMSDSFGSSGQSNLGSSNSINGSGMQSASFNSFDSKSMSDSFGSSGQSNVGSSNSINGSGMQSASFNSFGSKSISNSFGSSGQSNVGSSNSINGSGMQSASFNSFGSKSVSNSFGSSGQSNVGSSNSINGSGMQSASFNSFGSKSMSDSFGSSGQSNFGSSNSINGSGMQSASFNSFGGKSMSDSFGSSGQSNFGSSNSINGSGMQSASFNSFGKFSSRTSNSDVQPASLLHSSHPGGNVQSSFHSDSDAYQQTQNSMQQLPSLSLSQDSSGQSVQGLRGKSIGIPSGSGHLSSDQFLNTKNSMGIHQSNAIAQKVIRHGLQCASYGGPHSEEEYSELIYWQNIASDATFISHYYNPQVQESKVASPHRTKYLTFEMDSSGWNNIRLGFENMMLLAHSMGRTLVLPPKRQITHGMPDIHGSKTISFDDFYDIQKINAKQNGLNIISMEDFLEREAVNGNLNSKATGAAIYPPNNQVNWNNQNLDPLWDYIRNISRSFNWSPGQCVLAFPAKGSDDQHLFSMMADVLIEKDGRPFPDYSEFQGKPSNVDGPTIERFREVLAGRRKICLYDSKMHAENDVVHIKAEEDEQRLILPFYAFLFWEDWRQQLFALRFVRDNLVYNDAILCLGARMVKTIRDYVRQRSPENDGSYDAIHVRRGDFQIQYPSTQISADAILAGIQEEIDPGRTIYITTDERDLSFFEPLREVYDLKFIGDFGDMMKGVNPQFFGLAEQIVSSRSRVFFGTYYSTFSAYIVRLRGYYSVKENQPGYMSGALQNTYYLPSQWKNDMSIYQAVHAPFFAREFPIAWRDIDKF